MKVYDKINNDNFGRIKSLFTWMEDHDMLSEDGIIEKESLGIDTVFNESLFTEAGNDLLHRYYKRYASNFVNEDVDNYWNERNNDISKLKKYHNVKESSFELTKNMYNEFQEINSYLDSIDSNQPNGTTAMLMETVYDPSSHTIHARCTAVGSDHKRIESAAFGILSHNTLLKYDKDVHGPLTECMNEIYENIKQVWNSKPRMLKEHFMFKSIDTSVSGFLNETEELGEDWIDDKLKDHYFSNPGQDPNNALKERKAQADKKVGGIYYGDDSDIRDEDGVEGVDTTSECGEDPEN